MVVEVWCGVDLGLGLVFRSISRETVEDDESSKVLTSRSLENGIYESETFASVFWKELMVITDTEIHQPWHDVGRGNPRQLNNKYSIWHPAHIDRPHLTENINNSRLFPEQISRDSPLSVPDLYLHD